MIRISEDLKLLNVAITACIEAGRAILKVYASEFEVEKKEDQSPLTLADKNAHDIIIKYLSPAGIPIISEEGKHLAYEERKSWKRFWLVDPLDGTKEFIKRNGEFTVNIALIEDQTPVLGVIFTPVLSILHFGSAETGSRRIRVNNEDSYDIKDLINISDSLPYKKKYHKPYTVVCSKSHMNPETEDYISNLRKDHPNLEMVSKGSSLKMCLIAEGKADEYPRLGPTMEWDIAAGHAIILHSGGSVVRFSDSGPLLYNKENLLNPWFVARSVRSNDL